MKATRYFLEQVLRKRPYLNLEWVEQVLSAPEHVEAQRDGRVRHWRYIPALGRHLRVVTLNDGKTVHNAFPDRGYRGPNR